MVTRLASDLRDAQAATSFRAPASFAGSAFPQTVLRVPHQRREQIADNPARAGLDFDGDGHAG